MNDRFKLGFESYMNNFSPWGASRRAYEQSYAICCRDFRARRESLRLARSPEVRRVLVSSARMWIASARAIREQWETGGFVKNGRGPAWKV